MLESPDTPLKRRLIDEAAGVAIWALEGLARLRAYGEFTAPASSQETVEAFERVISPAKAFAHELCEVLGGSDTWVAKDKLFQKWKAWSEDRGTEPGTKAQFGEQLINAFPGLIKSNRRGPRGQQFTTYDGIRLCD